MREKTPGQYWAYGFYVLVGVPLALVLIGVAWQQARKLSALVTLPPAAALAGGDDGGRGAIYGGTLAGPVEVTPAGQIAVMWMGVLTRTNTKGRGRYTAEKCRLGAIDGRQLAGDDGRSWDIRAPERSVVRLDVGAKSSRVDRVRWALGPTTSPSEIPDSVIQQCHVNREDLRDQSFAWRYSEVAAPPGARAEIAGCATAMGIGACDTGPALGHLSTDGIRAMALRLADDQLETTALVVLIAMFFTLVAGIGATITLRRVAREAASGRRRAA